MIRFVVRRILAAVPIGLVVTLGVFALVFAMPGDPLRELAGDKPIPASVLAAKRAQFHLDRPFLVQYGLYMKDMAAGQFGSTFDGQDIGEQLKLRVPVTLRLALLANAFQWIIALLFGTYAGFKRNGAADRLLMASTLFVLAVPLLVLAFTAQYVLGVQLKVLPVSGAGAGFPQSYLLPAMALAVVGFAGIARVLRTSIVESVNSDFVKTARAKGLGEQRVLWRHIVPNAILPVVTIAGYDFAGIFAGAVLTESIFNLPGLGQFLFQAIRLKEGGVVVLLSMLAFVTFVLINLAVDVLYGVLDPRVRHG
ncbi:MAG: binding-protein-dependent transport system inner rane component [Actinomycetia bacterium]|jgi:ABC-type dipeptide/oligopeptide/nickel transport system permease component|nr:binding-protein-dependent transport system inner rane component [Actinomycetes bacterium]MDQ1653695.1 oligopeptide transport system permease protein [Cryptosporangiaceae bacterium]MDQ1655230.1 oligopeptide transport system permease protein [Cryptosporangiaceae bacterium]